MSSEKNWLIRTKSNHILGPVSKEKVLDLYNNKSIKSDDEICSGNGFWFFIREDEMVNRYLISNEVQGFNPISEAKDVLTAEDPNACGSSSDVISPDITLVAGLDLSSLKEVSLPPPQEESIGNEADSCPEVKEVPVLSQNQKIEHPNHNKKKIEIKTQSSKKTQAIQNKVVPMKKQEYLRVLGFFIFFLLLLLIYFRKSVMRYLFYSEIAVEVPSLIAPAFGQEEIMSKKKSY